MTALNIVDVGYAEPVPRDGYDRPLVVPKTGGKPIAHTRTTTFIDVLDDKSSLTDWKVRSALVGHHRLPEAEQQEITTLDVREDRDRLNALSEKAVALSGAHERREKGTELHGFSELVDAGLPLPESASEADLADMAAYRMATIDFEMGRMEQFVVCNILCAAGTYDRDVLYTGPGPLPGMFFREEAIIADLKTGRSADYGGLKMASQLAVYSRAEMYDHTLFPVPPLTARQKETGDPVKDYRKRIDNFKKIDWPAEQAAKAYTPLNVNQEWGIILHLPAGSGDATLYWADLTLGWEAAQEALTIRSLRSRGKRALIPFNSAAVQGAILSA